MSNVDDLFEQILTDGAAALKNNQLTATGTKREAYKKLSTGIMPGTWEVVGLQVTVLTYFCGTCGTKTECLSPPLVYLVSRSVHNHSDRHMRPVRKGELEYLLISKPLHVDRTEAVLEMCQACVIPQNETPQLDLLEADHAEPLRQT